MSQPPRSGLGSVGSVKLRFFGTIDDLACIITATGLDGSWAWFAAEGKWVFRCENHALLNWWPRTATVFFQGPDRAVTQLQGAIAAAVQERNAAQRHYLPAVTSLVEPGDQR